MCERESLLHHAVKNVFDTEVYDFLLENNINPYLRDSTGYHRNAMYHAAIYKNRPGVLYFWRKGIRIDREYL